MTNIFKAIDGRLFNSQERCLSYEYCITAGNLKLFDVNGRRTYEVDDACLAYLCDENALKRLVDACNIMGIICDGDLSVGFNVRSEETGLWSHISNKSMSALKVYFQEYYETTT